MKFLKSLLCRVRGHRFFNVHAAEGDAIFVGRRCGRCDHYEWHSVICYGGHTDVPPTDTEQLYRDLYSGFDGVRH